jgi:hypothetical protein
MSAAGWEVFPLRFVDTIRTCERLSSNILTFFLWRVAQS